MRKRINDVICIREISINERNKKIVLAYKNRKYRCEYEKGDYIIRVSVGYDLHLTEKILNQYFKLIL